MHLPRPAKDARDGSVRLRAGTRCRGSCLLAHASHAPALLGTAAARLRAFLAVRHRMLSALIGATVAHVRAHLANGHRKLARAHHVGPRHAADLRAVHVERYAPRHHLDVLLLQARCSAEIASIRTLVAGVNTGLILLLCHVFSPRSMEMVLPCPDAVQLSRHPATAGMTLSRSALKLSLPARRARHYQYDLGQRARVRRASP